VTAAHGAERAGRIKVVHLLVAGDIGGAERFLVDLASRGEETGADHAIAILTPNPKLTALLKGAGLVVHEGRPISEDPLSFLGRAFGSGATRFFEGVLRAERATLVHLHTLGAHVPGTRAAMRLGLPVLRTEHHWLHYRDPLTAPFTRWALRRTAAVACVSSEVRDVIARSAPSAARLLSVVHNGVDLSRFVPSPGPGAGPLRLAITCRLEPRKQVHLAIDALAAVPSATLEVAGDGSLRASLEARAAARGLGGRVRFLGFQPDVRPVLARAHAAICCSRDEGLPLAVLEPLALGRAVVATKVGGVPEIVTHGVHGLLAEGEAGALAGALRTLDAARAEALGRAGRARVEEAFSLEAMCRAYRSAYASAAGALPGGAR
jgi:L-malate glycosyltransferase